MSSLFTSRNLVIGVCVLGLVMALSYIDWNKDPNKWALGYWHESNLHLYAHVTPGKAKVIFPNGQDRGFYYEIHTEENPYPFEVWQGDRKWGDFYKGLLEFNGKNEAKLRAREQTTDPSDPLTAYASGFVMTWKRIPEAEMPAETKRQN